MSKFQNVLTEAAYAIAGHGFAENEVGSASEPGWGPWQATVRVTRSGLLNLGEDADLIDRYTAEMGNVSEQEFYVWIMEDDTGRVSMEAMCNADTMPDQIAVMDRDFAAVEDHYNTPVIQP